MNKQEKIISLETAMTRSRRDEKNEDSEFYHFTDDAPRELVDLYLKDYEVRDVDYESFSDAIDVVIEVHNNLDDELTDDEIVERIYEMSSDSASVYTQTRIEYLNIWNQYEISETMREYSLDDISTACAVWYDRQVEQMAIIINDWVNE
jgi:hypothetical protein